MLDSKIIADKYNLKLTGPNLKVHSFASLNHQSINKIIWCNSESSLDRVTQGTVLIPTSLEGKIKFTDELSVLICHKSPRLIFAKILNDYFHDSKFDDFTNMVALHRQNQHIKIGENCFIGENVIIGNGTEILHNTSIFSNTVIGENCHINTNCSIGTPGLGFEYDDDEMVKFPQLGGVIIENGVEIGPSTTIRRGALDNTIIGAQTKIGALSNIGHNCIVGKQCILTCQIVLGGSTRIGDKVFMGINSITKNKVKLGNNVQVGMGAVVTNDFPSDVTIYGVPAKKLLNEH